MPEIMRLNRDYVAKFGIAVSTPVQSVYVNGELGMVIGGYVTPHHAPNLFDQPVPMTQGSSNVRFERKQVCRVGDKAACGHKCTSGSTNTFAN